jgi:hypothetical protein
MHTHTNTHTHTHKHTVGIGLRANAILDLQCPNSVYWVSRVSRASRVSRVRRINLDSRFKVVGAVLCNRRARAHQYLYKHNAEKRPERFLQEARAKRQEVRGKRQDTTGHMYLSTPFISWDVRAVLVALVGI